MNYASIKDSDIADGTGVRVSLFVSGCQIALQGHPCRECQNKEAWDKNYGTLYTQETEDKIINLMDHDYIRGFSLLGGEPLSTFNIPTEIKLLKRIRKTFPDKDIWMWTGYDLDKWILYHDTEILKYIDIVIDGPFIQKLFSPDLKFRGSSNQRMLYMKDYFKD